LPQYRSYDENSIVEYLKKEHADVLFGIRQIKKVKVKSIEVDVGKINSYRDEHIGDALDFYIDADDLNYYMEDVVAMCRELKVHRLTIRIPDKNFYLKELEGLLHMVEQVCFEIGDNASDDGRIKTYLLKRYGEEIKVHHAEIPWEEPGKNYIYDSAVMIPYILHKAIMGENEKIEYKLVDSGRSSALASGERSLLNAHGMRKPAYYAYKMISDLVCGNIVDTGEGYAVSRCGETTRVLVYAEVQPCKVYKNPESLIKTTQAEIEIEERVVKLHNMNGTFRVQYYYYENQNSLLDVYGNFGYRNSLDRNEEEFVRWVTVPMTGFFTKKVLGLFTLDVKLTPNAAYMFIINAEETEK